MLGFHPKNRNSGFTIIELMVVVAVMAILAVISIPAVKGWVDSAKVRNAAAAITNGLQKARGEAIARNTNIEFILSADSSWTINLPGGGAIDSRAASEGSEGVAPVAAPVGATTVTFNSFGNVLANADGSASMTSVSTDLAGKHGLRVIINSGTVRMCNPRITAGSSPRAC